jgi:thymidylate kinase
MDEGLRPIAELPGVAKPDLSVLLVAEEGARLRRLRARHAQDNFDRRFEGNTAFMRRVLREFRKMGLIEIDTTHLAPTEVVESILGLIPQSTREAQQPALLS